MNNPWLVALFRSFLWLFLQIIIFEPFNEKIAGLTLYPYIIGFLWLPITTPVFLGYIWAVVFGFILDIAFQTYGLHTSASIFLVYARKFVLQILSPSDGYEVNDKAHLASLGFRWFSAYSLILIALHHFWVIVLEQFEHFFSPYTLGKLVLSTGISFVLILVLDYLVAGKKR